MVSVGGGSVVGKDQRLLASGLFVSEVPCARDGELTDLRLRMRGIFGMSCENFCYVLEMVM